MSVLKTADPEIAELIEEERQRQIEGLELIASENFTSPGVLEALGSIFTNKYSEGLPGRRYYGGAEVIDKVETLCQQRALKAFNLSAAEWHVNVQAYSGSPANFAVYMGLLQPHDRIMGLGLSSGGHLTHGYYTPSKRLSASSIFFESLPYTADPATGLIDFPELVKLATSFRPRLIICGASSYVRKIDFAAFRKIADDLNCLLMADISHISGLVASGLHPCPFEAGCDVVTTTTHKTLRGPRSALIFVNKTRQPTAVIDAVDSGVFPGLQGGPHNHQIAAVAVQLKEVATLEFKKYAQQVIDNAAALGAELMSKGQRLVTGGTENHMVLWDLTAEDVTGSKYEKVAQAAGISVNKNTVPGDKNAMSPRGVRVGTAAMTTRGCGTEEMKIIATFLMRVLEVCKIIQDRSGKKLADFEKMIDNCEEVIALREDVKTFARKLPFPTPAAS